jgi:hypothetical protein
MEAVNKSRPSQQKRQRERQKQERRTEKLARRQEAAEKRATSPGRPDGVDPDLEGIQPGPQPLQEWQKADVEAEADSEKSDS